MNPDTRMTIAAPHAAPPVAFSPARVGAMVLRHWYLLRSSWARLLDLLYWPAVQLLTWGFVQTYIGENSAFFSRAGGTFIAAVLLWDVLFRGQIGFSISFLEEMWSRNVGNLLMSPLRPVEFVAALMMMSVIRLVIGLAPTTLLAVLIFDFNIYALGPALASFFVNLIMTSWAVALVVSGLVLRNGMGAENLAWTLMFLLLPLAAVYYPVAVLPAWVQALSWALPPTYVFEGMRALVMEGNARPDLMFWALGLNALYLGAGLAAFFALLRSARRRGSLLAQGE